MQPELAALPIVLTVNQNLAFGRFEEPAGQVDQRRFARASLTDNSNRRAGRNVQVEMAENIFAAIRIMETDVSKLDFAADRLPVLFLRLKCRAIFGND